MSLQSSKFKVQLTKKAGKKGKRIRQTGYFESSEIAEVFTIDTSTAKYVDDVVYESGSMTFSWRGNEADAC